jgi:hypothetical protein
MDLFSFLNEQSIARDALSAQHKANHVQGQLQDLERQHEQLKLLTRALWALLKESQGLTDADLKRHLQTLQAGAAKAGTTAPFQLCESCRHQVPVAVKTCPYCGRAMAGVDTVL